MQQGIVFVAGAAGDPQTVMTESLVQAVFDLDCRIFPDPIAGTPMCIPISQKVKQHHQT
jgi:iron complex transport system ATP-binding protein